MPQVPTVTAPTVRRNLPSGGFNNTRASADAFGAGVGRGLQQVGQGVGEVANQLEKQALKIKQEDDQMAVMQAENQLLEWEQSNLYDPENGYFGREGKNALGGSATLPSDYDKRAGEIFAQLSNDDQRRAFNKIATQRRFSIQNGVAKHEASQRKRVLSEEAAALQQQSLDAAANSYTDTNAVVFNINRGVASVMAQSVQEGDSDTVRMEKVRQYTSDAHVSVINRMMNDNPTAAMEYFEENKDLMTATAIDAIQDDLEVEVQKDTARNEAERIYADGGGLSTMLKEARKIKDTGVSDETIKRIKAMHNEQETIEQEQHEQAWSNLVDEPSYDNIPANIDGTVRKSMRDYVDKRLTGQQAKTDWTYYAELSNMDENTLKQHSIDPSRLSNAHLKQFIDTQAKARQGDTTGFYTANNVATVSKEIAKTAGVKSDVPLAKFTSRMRQEVEVEEAQLGRKLKYEEVKQVGDRLLIERGGFFGSTDVFKIEVDGVDPLLIDEAVNVLMKYDVKPNDEEIKTLVSEVAENRDNIVEALQKRGHPVTTSNIMGAYMQWKRDNDK